VKITFQKDRDIFVLEGTKAEERDGDLFLDGKLVGWYNIPDRGWFIAGLIPGRPKDITYWNSAVIS